MLAGELVTHGLAHGVDVAPPQGRVRARKVDVLEDARELLPRRKGTHGARPVVVDHEHLARLDVALHLGFHQVQGHVSEATTHASSSRPSVSGRNPYGSRIAYSASGVSTSREYAPLTCASAWRSCSSSGPAGARASRCRMTSVSDVDWKIAPSRSMSLRRASAFVRLPLCAIEIGPRAVLAVIGWAFFRFDEPAVE